MNEKVIVKHNRVGYGTQNKEELILKIKYLYEEGKSQHDISREIGIPRGTISRWMVERDIKGRPCGEAGKLKSKKYNYNENYFESINTRDKAYLLGFIVGDGCVVDEGKRKRMQISLSMDDKEHLLNIAEKLDAIDRVYDHKPLEKWGNRGKEHPILRIDSTKMCNDLISLGVIPRKTGYEKLIKFDDADLQWSFIRGFFDADGCICFNSRKRYVASFTGNYEFLNDLLELFKSIGIGLGVKTIQQKQGCFNLALGKKSDLIEMYKLMYKYPEDIKLNRKYEKFSSLMI